MTPEEIREKLAELASQRSAHVEELEGIVAAAETDAREFTTEEAEKRGRLLTKVEQVDERKADLEDQLRAADDKAREERSLAAVAQLRRELGLGDQTRGIDGVTDINEHRTYERGNGVSYLKDIVARSFGPGIGSAWSQATERLARHAQENHRDALDLEAKSSRSDAEDFFVRQMVEQTQNREQYQGAPAARQLSYRAISTASGAGGEFVPPMYLTEQWLEFLRAGRVFANNMHHEDLPDGTMSINIPKVTSGTSVAAQNGQNTNVSMTDLQTAFVTVPVITVAGGQIVSLQLLERSPIQFDEVVWKDLAKAHAQQMDLQALNGSGSAGNATGLLNTSGITTVTWTQATPTVKGLMGQVGLAKADVANALFLPATHAFMTPNCWEWIGQSTDTQNRPLVVPEYNGPFNAVQVAPDSAVAEGAVGRRFSGLDTYEDANIPANLGGGTNQDVVVVGRMSEGYLYESPVVTRALPQTYGTQLSVLLQLYSYAALSFARYPTAFSVISGTGLASANRTFNS